MAPAGLLQQWARISREWYAAVRVLYFNPSKTHVLYTKTPQCTVSYDLIPNFILTRLFYVMEDKNKRNMYSQKRTAMASSSYRIISRITAPLIVAFDES